MDSVWVTVSSSRLRLVVFIFQFWQQVAAWFPVIYLCPYLQSALLLWGLQLLWKETLYAYSPWKSYRYFGCHLDYQFFQNSDRATIHFFGWSVFDFDFDFRPRHNLFAIFALFWAVADQTVYFPLKPMKNQKTTIVEQAKIANLTGYDIGAATMKGSCSEESFLSF